MRVAVVTPYYNESTEKLRRCYDSVRGQTFPAVHLFVADGQPNPEIDRWDCDHLIIIGPNRDAGNMARGIGALQCAAHDFDAIAFLDSDNWYKPDHVASLVRLIEKTDAHVGVALRDIHKIDGGFLQAEGLPDVELSIDTNCFFLTKSVFPLLPLWTRLSGNCGGLHPKTDQRNWSYGGLIGDKIFTYALRTFNVPIAVNDHSTICYTVKSAIFYEYLNEVPPPGSVRDEDLIAAWQWWTGLSSEERVRLVVSALPRDRHPSIIRAPRPARAVG